MLELINKILHPEKKNPRAGDRKQRRFSAAVSNRLQSWLVSWQRINADLKSDYKTMVMRSRELSVNNEYVSGLLSCMCRNVIGPAGFRLQCFPRDASGRVDRDASSEIVSAWTAWSLSREITTDRSQSGRDLDILILRTLLIDGECFISRRESSTGVSYAVLDSMDVDIDCNVQRTPEGGRIVMGVEIDPADRVVAYHIRSGAHTDTYPGTDRVRVPAKNVIHLFRRYMPCQVRGITPLSAVILNLNQLDSYKEAELIAARVQACQMGIWEQVGASDLFGSEDVNEAGEYVTEMAPGIFGFAPKGYKMTQIANSHPGGNFGSFVKNILRGISNSVGISYNKAAGDYESVNYSSLREAQLEDRGTWEDLQNFLIQNWKTVQYRDFLKAYLLSGKTALKFVRFEDFCRVKFLGKRPSWVDPVKDMQAVQLRLQLRVSDPITELEELGKDPEQVLDNWKKWLDLCAERGIQNPDAPDIIASSGEDEENDERNPLE